MQPNEIVERGGDRFHVADPKGRPYVRLTFKPYKARKRTTWAIKTGDRSYLACGSDGDPDKEIGKKILRRELILVGEGDAVERPAGFSFKYGELCVLPEEVRS